MEFYSRGPDDIDRDAGCYRAVTVAQVNEAAMRHLHPGHARSSPALDRSGITA